MARKKRVEEHENHERWLVSYADFITLLFAFFVVMYSMSSVNEGKYRVLSASMVAAFSPSTRSLTPIQIGELVRSSATPFPAVKESPEKVKIAPITMLQQASTDTFYVNAEVKAAAEASGMGGISPDVEGIAATVIEFFEQLITDEQIQVRKYPYWLEVEIKSNILFNSGSANLAEDAEGVLLRLSGVLQDYTNRVVVEGFTDDRPINSPVYPSNWELSSARAARVIRTFQTFGIEADRMTSIGYGEFRPISTNDTEVGRASNRRVIIVVMTNIDDLDISGEISSDDLNLLRMRNGN